MTNYTKEQLAEQLNSNPDLGIAKPTIAALNAVDAKSDRVKASVRSKSQAKQPEAAAGEVKRYALIKMDYPGSVISENHYLGRNGNHTYVKSEARDWQNELIYRINILNINWRLPLKVYVTGVFKNNRSICDLHNFKCLYDAIQTATGLNDKSFHTETIPGVIDKTQRPHILITITEI